MPLSITEYNKWNADPKRSASAQAGAAKRVTRQRHRTGIIRYLQKHDINATELEIAKRTALPSHATCCQEGAFWEGYKKLLPTTLMETFA